MTIPKIPNELRKRADILRTDDFERDIPYLYLDSVGILTIGIGHNLESHPLPSPQSMSFVVRRLERHATSDGSKGISITDNPVIGRAASAQEIQNDIDFLKSHVGLKHYQPQNLAKYTTVELVPWQVTSLFERDLDEAFRACRDEFTHQAFLSFPLSCQTALLDIAFNCGGFSRFQGHFVPAIKGTGIYAGKLWQERWTVAAEYSRRGKAGLARNAIVKKWFQEGAKFSAIAEEA